MKSAMRAGKKDPQEILDIPSIAEVVSQIDAELEKRRADSGDKSVAVSGLQGKGEDSPWNRQRSWRASSSLQTSTFGSR